MLITWGLDECVQHVFNPTGRVFGEQLVQEPVGFRICTGPWCLGNREFPLTLLGDPHVRGAVAIRLAEIFEPLDEIRKPFFLGELDQQGELIITRLGLPLLNHLLGKPKVLGEGGSLQVESFSQLANGVHVSQKKWQ